MDDVTEFSVFRGYKLGYTGSSMGLEVIVKAAVNLSRRRHCLLSLRHRAAVCGVWRKHVQPF